MFFIDFRERGREGERERETSVASPTCLTGAQTRNLGTCPEWKLNLRPFGSQRMLRPSHLASKEADWS